MKWFRKENKIPEHIHTWKYASEIHRMCTDLSCGLLQVYEYPHWEHISFDMGTYVEGGWKQWFGGKDFRDWLNQANDYNKKQAEWKAEKEADEKAKQEFLTSVTSYNQKGE